MAEQTKKCPRCAEEIKAEARICRYCRTRFEVSIQGYCLRDHQLVTADENVKCPICQGELSDKQVLSHMIEEELAPGIQSLQPIASAATVTPSSTAQERAVNGAAVKDGLHLEASAHYKPLARLLFSFKGRIPRSTYWYFILGYITFIMLASMATALPTLLDESSFSNALISFFSAVMIIVYLVAPFCSWTVAVKRAHDRDHSGWYLLIGLIPFIGGLILLGELGFMKGTEGKNQYGPDPLTAKSGESVVIGWMRQGH